LPKRIQTFFKTVSIDRLCAHLSKTAAQTVFGLPRPFDNAISPKVTYSSPTDLHTVLTESDYLKAAGAMKKEVPVEGDPATVDDIL
jgi:hypothetical protein